MLKTEAVAVEVLSGHEMCVEIVGDILAAVAGPVIGTRQSMAAGDEDIAEVASDDADSMVTSRYAWDGPDAEDNGTSWEACIAADIAA